MVETLKRKKELKAYEKPVIPFPVVLRRRLPFMIGFFRMLFVRG